jgi:hypothetical protein
MVSRSDPRKIPLWQCQEEDMSNHCKTLRVFSTPKAYSLGKKNLQSAILKLHPSWRKKFLSTLTSQISCITQGGKANMVKNGLYFKEMDRKYYSLGGSRGLDEKRLHHCWQGVRE